MAAGTGQAQPDASELEQRVRARLAMPNSRVAPAMPTGPTPVVRAGAPTAAGDVAAFVPDVAASREIHDAAIPLGHVGQLPEAPEADATVDAGDAPVSPTAEARLAVADVASASVPTEVGRWPALDGAPVPPAADDTPATDRAVASVSLSAHAPIGAVGAVSPAFAAAGDPVLPTADGPLAEGRAVASVTPAPEAPPVAAPATDRAVASVTPAPEAPPVDASTAGPHASPAPAPADVTGPVPAVVPTLATTPVVRRAKPVSLPPVAPPEAGDAAAHDPSPPAAPAVAPRLGDDIPAKTTGSAPPRVVDATAHHRLGKRPAKQKKVTARTIAAGPPRKKRHPFKAFFKLVLVLGILGGAAYAGYWYKFLRNDVEWSDDVAPSAKVVEDVLGHSFEEDVPVQTLAADAYQLQLTAHVARELYAEPTAGNDLGTGAAAAAGVVSGPIPTSIALRAAGLVGAEVPASVGPMLAANITSFYDGGTIYRLEGNTALSEVDLLRSLTAALVDQRLDIGTAALTDAQRAGVRTLADGVANQVLEVRFGQLSALRDSAVQELTARVGALADQSVPTYVATYLSSRTSAALPRLAADGDPLAGVGVPVDDAATFDPTRAADPAPAQGSVDRELGMQFWFDLLVPALGAEDARNAALLWQGDSSRPAMTQGAACLISTVSVADETAEGSLLGALQRWAGARADVVIATATALDTGSGVSVQTCATTDAPPVPTSPASDTAMPFERAAIESALLGRAHQLGLADAPPQNACTVAAIRNGAGAGFDPAGQDPQLIAQLADVVAFCTNAAAAG